MSDETKTCKIPAINRHGIVTWLEAFSGALMGYKRAHLALKDPRPSLDPAEEEKWEGNPTRLRIYLSDLKEDQDYWDERNDIARNRLIESAKDTENSEARQIIFAAIKEDKTAKEICELLTRRFQNTDSRVVNAAVKYWTKMKAVKGEKATSFITRLKEQQEHLKQKGKTYSDGELVGRLLEGMSEAAEYGMIIAALETVKDLTFADAIQALQTKDEAEAAGGPVEVPETVAMANGTIDTASSFKKTTNENCQICHKTGHTAANCHFRYKEKKPRTEGQQNHNKGSKGNNKTTKNMKDVKCYNCDKTGHYARDCRSKNRKNKDHPTNGDNNNKKSKPNNTGSWDRDEFSGMFQEDNNNNK